MYRRILLYALITPFFIFASILIHESGHAITGKIFGLGDPVIYIWPGYEIYPSIEEPSPSNVWPENALAFVRFPSKTSNISLEFPATFESHIRNPTLKLQPIGQNEYEDPLPIVGVMGSGFTYLISIFCTLCIVCFNPNGKTRSLLFVGSLLFYDILFYTVFPTFFGLSHLIFVGSNLSEPILYLAEMGIPKWSSITFILISCLLQISVLINIFSLMLRTKE